MTKINRELMKGSIELILLAVLEHEPMYGYQIAKEVKASSRQILQLKEGSLYPALHRLEQAGLVVSTWQTRDDGAPRRYYRLTPLGREEVKARRAEWQTFTSAVEGVLRHA
ncbi:PadR family transcriptional regulator [Ktedonospora formicarum]|uniref:Putative DNA-binding protein YwzG n=1 Tax=Ktedonospora formicarum TaxID=2778364 RepID=A0A8J3IAD3_9CHLR|nr:PadR family transcriptional regulator [Ktedonospora formicarum]GHO50213.1 putative DNA-binding protein YwzG [Ktedonospora formicarum]